MENKDTSIDSLVCDSCWKGIFSAEGWRTVLAAKQVPGRTGFSKGYSYKATWETIHAAADHCTWCHFLARPDATKGEVEVWAACDKESDCTPTGDKKLTVVVQGHYSSMTYYYMYTSEKDNAAKFVAARERVRDLTSPKSYELALECLKNCVSCHEKCPKPLKKDKSGDKNEIETLLPDRVIDCTNTKKPKLVLTGRKPGRYVTLSYVWGARQPLMTTKENIEKYLTEGLDMSRFPQTIQDAVIATKSLGEQYLWIDAQCIIQDSDEDKARQLGMMHYIYRNSYFTINAACADAATKGFLNRPRPQKIPNAQIPYRCPDGTIGSVWIARVMDTDIPDASHSYWDEIEPATYRGWCFQERMLPPRSFIYASDTLKYYCQTETANIGHALCEPSTGMRLPNAVYNPDTALSDADRKANRQAWLAALFTYTLRSISHASDKLVAMAGLVEQFQKVYQDEYLAGLWRKTLLLDLLWQSESAGGPHVRPKDYRAPSWSWAAVDGLISAQYIEESSGSDVKQAEIINCKTTLKSEEVPFGEVTAGVLTLKTYLKEVVLEDSGAKVTATVVRTRVKEGQEPVKIGYTTFDAEERAGKVYIVPLLWNVDGTSTKGLIVTEANDGKYRRVGSFTNGHDCKDMKWLEDLSQQEITLV